MRVRIDRLHHDIRYGNNLQQTVNALTGVTEVRINPAASSIIITYQISQLPEQTVLDCLGVSLPIAKVTRPEKTPVETDKPASDFVEEAEELTAEIASVTMGETIGEIVGETVGELLMGPAGMLIGAEVGGQIGGEIAETLERGVEELIEPKPPNPPLDRNNQKNTPKRQK
jgi:copper chaperone CopZ